MNLLTWLKRLLGIKGPKSPQVVQATPPKPTDSPTKAPQSRTAFTPPSKYASPAEFAKLVAELQRKAALWPEIWAALNSDDDPEVQRLLIELRGPHMFTPHVALNALEEACQRRFRQGQGVDRVAIIQTALKSCEPFSQ